MTNAINTRGVSISFGKGKGKFVPVLS